MDKNQGWAISHLDVMDRVSSDFDKISLRWKLRGGAFGVLSYAPQGGGDGQNHRH
jgi:hypothetical protein